MKRKKSRYESVENNVTLQVCPDTSRKVSFTIMAHPKRGQWAEELAAQIPATITWDEKNDRHDTGLRAIKAHGVNVTHHCVVQDDAIIVPNFKEIVENLIQYPEPESPISLYYGGKGKTSSLHASAHDLAVRHKASWLVRKGPIWGPGIIYPVSTIPSLVKYFEKSVIENYDRRVMRYYQSVNQDCWYTVPSLVEHRLENNPSLCGHNLPNRQARMFAGPQSALDIEWSGPIVRSRT